MTEKNPPHVVQLTPMLLVNCKLTWKKLLVFMVFGNLVACFLYLFGFGATFAYTILFCNCAAWPGFLLVVGSNFLPKPKTVLVMVLRLSAIMFVGTMIGALVFLGKNTGRKIQKNTGTPYLFSILFLATCFSRFHHSLQRILK